jgi:hypothetical protein
MVMGLNLGGIHAGTDTTRRSSNLFTDPDRAWEERKVQRQLLLDGLDEVLTLLGLKGTSGAVQEKRCRLLVQTFGSSSKTYYEEKASLDQLRDGLATIRERHKTELAATLNDIQGAPGGLDLGILTPPAPAETPTV